MKMCRLQAQELIKIWLVQQIQTAFSKTKYNANSLLKQGFYLRVRDTEIIIPVFSTMWTFKLRKSIATTGSKPHYDFKVRAPMNFPSSLTGHLPLLENLMNNLFSFKLHTHSSFCLFLLNICCKLNKNLEAIFKYVGSCLLSILLSVPTKRLTAQKNRGPCK